MPFWLFGYGSLVSLAPHAAGGDKVKYARKVEGHVRGYRRTWHQGSTDHRGTPEAPGRTVTLVPWENGTVVGAAFEVVGATAEEENEAMAYLEWREKQYDVRLELDFFEGPPPPPGVQVTDAPICRCLTFVGTPAAANVNYLGRPDSMDALAAQIATRQGPSGLNRDYLFSLSTALREFFSGALAEFDDCTSSDKHYDDFENEVEALFALERAVRAKLG